MTTSAKNSLAEPFAKAHAPLSEATAMGGNNAIAKVMADIFFLRDRIELMNSHRNPNPAVLQTYTSMLARREMALTLLQNDAAPPQS